MVHPHMLEEDAKIAVTVSIGCATMSSDFPFKSAIELLDAADRCLYAAKQGGRNRVVAYDQLNSYKLSAIDCA